MSETPAALKTPIFERIYQRYCNQPRLTAVAVRDWPSASTFLQEIVPAGYPVVFRASEQQSAGDTSDTFKWLRTSYGHCLLRVRVYDYAAPATYATARQYQEITLAEYLDQFELPAPSDHPPRYAGNQALPGEIADRLSIRPPNFYPPEAFEAPAFWLGPSGSLTPLHKDSTDNFSFQLCGTKRWTLFPVRDVPYLEMSRPNEAPEMDFAVSAIDLRNPSTDRGADLQSAQAIDVTVQPGQMLYLPAGWAHYVETITPALTINFWQSRAFFRSFWVDQP